MERLFVFSDFDFLPKEELIGTLDFERIRGNEVYSFRFSPQWIEHHNDIMLCADLTNSLSTQYANGAVFGCFSDALPDRWGRNLIDYRERQDAINAGRPVRRLTSFDYLISLDDFTRLGALRFRRNENGPYLNDVSENQVPPITYIRELVDASLNIESAVNRGDLPNENWLRQLLKPGSSLGGARPKSNVIDERGILHIAKFPSRNDNNDVGLWEHLCHILATNAGINAAQTKVIETGNRYHTLLSRRFDRTNDGKRIHFASSMSLLGLSDGDGAQTGKGYLDIVDFIIRGCHEAHKNLLELYRRIAFNICIGNCDDHFRNHGFILTPRGWTLSPAYDLNPSVDYSHALLISDKSNNSDLNLLLECHEDYFIERDKALSIIDEVKSAVKNWEKTAISLKIPKNEISIFKEHINHQLGI